MPVCRNCVFIIFISSVLSLILGAWCVLHNQRRAEEGRNGEGSWGPHKRVRLNQAWPKDCGEEPATAQMPSLCMTSPPWGEARVRRNSYSEGCWRGCPSSRAFLLWLLLQSQKCAKLGRSEARLRQRWARERSPRWKRPLQKGLKFKTRDSGSQREEKGQQIREAKRRGPGGIPEKGCHSQLDSFWVCWRQMHERGTWIPRGHAHKQEPGPCGSPRALHYLPLSLVQPGERNRHGAYRWGFAASCLGLGCGSQCSPQAS